MNTQLIASVCLVLSVATALTPAEPEFFRKSRYDLLEKQFTKESLLHETGINWTWKSWLVGPTCPDNVVDGVEVADVDLTSDAMEKAFKNIDLLVDVILKQLKLQKYKLGISTGIIYNGKVIYNKGFGSVDMDKDVPPSGDTIFSIDMLMNLVEKGIVNFDDPVSKFYNEQEPPVFTPVNPYGSKRHQSITLRSLATHTSGLPREPACSILESCDEETIFAFINALPIGSKPLTTGRYSNLGSALLSHCLERAYSKVTGRDITYEDWLKENVFDVIGMPDTGFNVSDSASDRLAIGYGVGADGKQVVSPEYKLRLGWSNGAGGLYSTTDDMLAFIGDILNGDESVSLGPDAYEFYTLPGINFPDGLSSYGLGTWENYYANGYHTLTKGGLLGGFGTSICLVPELKLGIVTWVNFVSGSIPDEISAIAVSEMVAAITSELRKNTPSYPFPAEIDEIVGNYSFYGTTYITIEKESPEQTSGYLHGNLMGYNVLYTYDKEYTEALQLTSGGIGLRVRQALMGLDSCSDMASMGLDKGILIIQKVDDTYYASSPDFHAFSIPKDKN